MPGSLLKMWLYLLALDFCRVVGRLSEPEKPRLSAQLLLNASMVAIGCALMHTCGRKNTLRLLWECATPHIPLMSRYVTSCDEFTRSHHTLVPQVTNAGVRRPGCEAKYHLPLDTLGTNVHTTRQLQTTFTAKLPENIRTCTHQVKSTSFWHELYCSIHLLGFLFQRLFTGTMNHVDKFSSMIRSLKLPCRWRGIIRRHESVKGMQLCLCVYHHSKSLVLFHFLVAFWSTLKVCERQRESTGNSYHQPIWVKCSWRWEWWKVYTTSSSQSAISWYVMWIVSTQLEGCRDAWTNHIQCSGRAQSPDPALHLALQSQPYNTVSSLSESVQHVTGMRIPQAIMRCALNRAASLHLRTY